MVTPGFHNKQHVYLEYDPTTAYLQIHMNSLTTWDEFFLNSDSINYPVTSCGLYNSQGDSEDCDPNDTGLIPFSGTEIWFDAD